MKITDTSALSSGDSVRIPFICIFQPLEDTHILGFMVSFLCHQSRQHYNVSDTSLDWAQTDNPGIYFNLITYLQSPFVI